MSLFRMTSMVLRSLFGRPYTVKYPFGPRVFHGEITRGKVGINIKQCIFCSLCQARCPTDAIEVRKEEMAWSIDRLRCITCGACVECCPKQCLFMEEGYAKPVTERGREAFKGA